MEEDRVSDKYGLFHSLRTTNRPILKDLPIVSIDYFYPSWYANEVNGSDVQWQEYSSELHNEFDIWQSAGKDDDDYSIVSDHTPDMSYFDAQFDTPTNHCYFMVDSDMVTILKPNFERQKQWSEKFLCNIYSRFYDSEPQLLLRDFICVKWAGSRESNFATLLAHGFQVLQGVISKIRSRSSRESCFSLTACKRKLEWIHYNKMTKRLVLAKREAQITIHLPVELNDPFHIISGCFDISHDHNKIIPIIERKSNPGYHIPEIESELDISVTDAAEDYLRDVQYDNEIEETEGSTEVHKNTLLNARSLMNFLINKEYPGFKETLYLGRFRKYGDLFWNFNDYSLHHTIRFKVIDPRNDDVFVHYILYPIDGGNTEAIKELEKVGREINYNIRKFGSIEIAILDHLIDRHRFLDQYSKIFANGSINHLTCYIYHWFGDIEMKRQLRHRELLIPLLEEMMSRINQSNMLQMRIPWYKDQPRMDLFYYQIDRHEPILQEKFAVVLIEKLKRIRSDGFEYDVVEYLSTNSKSILALIPMTLLNQVGSLRYSITENGETFQRYSMYSDKNPKPEGNYNRLTLQLMPIKEIAIELQNASIKAVDLEIFEKVVSYAIIDEESMTKRDSRGNQSRYNNIHNEFLQILPDNVNIRMIATDVLRVHTHFKNSGPKDIVSYDKYSRCLTTKRVKSFKVIETIEIEYLREYNMFSKLFINHKWNKGINENILSLYDPKSIVYINNKNVIMNEFSFTDRVYQYLSSIQERYQCFVKKVTRDDFVINRDNEPEFKRGNKPLVLELLNDSMQLNVYEYISSVATPQDDTQFACRYKDDENYFYFIDTKVSTRWEEFLLLKDTIRLEVSLRNEQSFRNSNVLYDIKTSPSDAENDADNNKNQNNKRSRTVLTNSTEDETEDRNRSVRETREILRNSFAGRVAYHNSNPYTTFHSSSQMIQGSTFDLVLLLSYDRINDGRPINHQRPMSYGLVFLKKNSQQSFNSLNTIQFKPYEQNNDARCYGAGIPNEEDPKFLISIKDIKIQCNRQFPTNTQSPCLGVQLFAINDFVDDDNINADLLYDPNTDFCNRMSFHHIIGVEQLRDHNNELLVSGCQFASNYTIVPQDSNSSLRIGEYLRDNRVILQRIVDNLYQSETFAGTKVTYNGVHNVNLKPMQYGSAEYIFNPIVVRDKYLPRQQDEISNVIKDDNYSDTVVYKNSSLSRNFNTRSNNNDNNNSLNNANKSHKYNNKGYCSMIRSIPDQKLTTTKITIEITTPTNLDEDALRRSISSVLKIAKEGSVQNSHTLPVSPLQNIFKKRCSTNNNVWSQNRSRCTPWSNVQTGDVVIGTNDSRFRSIRLNKTKSKSHYKPSKGTAYYKSSLSQSQKQDFNNLLKRHYTRSNPIPRSNPIQRSNPVPRSIPRSAPIINAQTTQYDNRGTQRQFQNKLPSNDQMRKNNKASHNLEDFWKKKLSIARNIKNLEENLSLAKRKIPDFSKRATPSFPPAIPNSINRFSGSTPATSSGYSHFPNSINISTTSVRSPNIPSMPSISNSNNTTTNQRAFMIQIQKKNYSNRITSSELALVDSGSSNSHMITDKHFDSIDYNSIMATEVANGSIVKTSGEGVIGRHTNICYTPSFSQNIVAISTLTEADEVVCFSKSRGAFTIRAENFNFHQKVSKKLIKINDMYYINVQDLKQTNAVYNPPPIKSLTFASVASTHPPVGSIILWHQRLHISNNYIKRLNQLDLVIGMKINDCDMKRQLAVCESCMYSKFTRNAFFKKYEEERRERYKIAKRDQKEFMKLKKTLPYSGNPLKYNKYPDEPLSPFDNYNKDDMIVEEEAEVIPKFVKVKYNPLQNNLVGEIYGFISVDLKGPFNIAGFNGERYLMAFLDSKASMQAELYMIPDKKQETTSLKLEKYLQTIIIPNRKSLNIVYQFSIFHSDNGSEFQKAYAKVCNKHNVKQSFTTVRTPELNGVVERYWRSIMGPMMAMMFSSKMDKRLWPYCASHVNDIILNQLRIITYKGKVTTTFQVITSQKPNLERLRTWGCEVFALDTRKYDPRHFTEKSFKGYFMGFDRASKAALIFDPHNDEIISTNHIQYNEILHGIRDVNNVSVVNLNFQSINANMNNEVKDKFYSEDLHYWEDDEEKDYQQEYAMFTPENGTEIGNNHIDKAHSKKLSKRTRDHYEIGQVNNIDQVEEIINELPTITLGSVNYEEGYKDPNDNPVDSDLANEFFNKMYLKDSHVNSDNIDNISYKAERRITVAEAINGPDKMLWRKAIQDEYDGQDKLNSFSVCIKPDSIPLLDWILIFKRKFDDRGNVEKYKVRATLRGDKQVEDADYHEVYAPVGKLSSLRIFICLVAYYGFEWIQVDYISAFLQAQFDDNHTLHLTFPPLYNLQNAIDKLPADHPIRKIPKNEWKARLCLKMNKSIYGLKQAPKAWYDVLNKSLITMGFFPLQNEPCIYIFTRQNGDKYFLFLYVDDTLIAGKDKMFIDSLIKMIQSKHSIKVLGEPKFILGLKLTRCNDGNIIIDQNQYIKDVATRFEVISNPNKLVRMPCTAAQFKRIEDESKIESLIDITIDIRSMVGSLMYASMGTRPDITYFVNYISRYLTKPTEYIKKIILQAINYLLDTPFIYIICFHNYKKDPQVVTFVDAGHASELNRKGITANLLKFGKTPVLWNSTKQTTYSLSTAETEYKALSETLKETIYLKSLFEELGLKQELPLRVYEDNTATIAMSNNPIINKKSKHIELAFHYFKDYVQRKIVQLFYIASKNQEADLLTKIVMSMDLFYSLIKKVFNLSTITSPKEETVAKVLMIKTMTQEPQNPNARYMSLLQIANHHRGSGHGMQGSGYHNSEEFDRDRVKEVTVREEAYFQWMNDGPFSLKELLLLAIILESYLKNYAKEYVRFFPNSTLVDANYKIRYAKGLEHLREFHQFMEENVLSIQLMREINALLKYENNPDRQFTKAEIEVFILMTKDKEALQEDVNNNNDVTKMGFCNVITNVQNSDITKECIDWINKREDFQNYLSQVNKYNLPQGEKQKLIEVRRDKIAKEYIPEVNEDELWLSKENTFNSEKNRINQVERISTDERQSLLEAARKKSLERKKRAEESNNQITSLEYSRAVAESSNHQQNAIANEAYAEAFNQMQPQISTSKPVFKRLKRNRDDPRNVIEQRINNNPIPTKPQPIQYKHSKLTDSQKHEFIHLCHTQHENVYNQIITQMAYNNSMFDDQARVQRRHNHNQDYDEDDKNNYNEVRNEFDSESNEESDGDGFINDNDDEEEDSEESFQDKNMNDRTRHDAIIATNNENSSSPLATIKPHKTKAVKTASASKSSTNKPPTKTKTITTRSKDDKKKK